MFYVQEKRYIEFIVLIHTDFRLFTIERIANDFTSEIDHAPKVVQTASQHMLDLDMYSSNAILVNLDENQIVLDKKVRKDLSCFFDKNDDGSSRDRADLQFTRRNHFT